MIEKPKADACMASLPLPLCARIGQRLFPSRWVEVPKMLAGIIPTDVLCQTIDIEISFFDRLRILFSGRARVQAKTATSEKVGIATTASSFHALPPKFLGNPYDKFMGKPYRDAA